MSKGVVKTKHHAALKELESSLSYVLKGDLKKAEAILSKTNPNEDEYVNGYRDALRGLLNSLNSQDKKSFVFRLTNDPQFLKNELGRLKDSEESHLCTEWDLGYFKCWTAYLEGLIQISARTEK